MPWFINQLATRGYHLVLVGQNRNPALPTRNLLGSPIGLEHWKGGCLADLQLLVKASGVGDQPNLCLTSAEHTRVLIPLPSMDPNSLRDHLALSENRKPYENPIRSEKNLPQFHMSMATNCCKANPFLHKPIHPSTVLASNFQGPELHET